MNTIKINLKAPKSYCEMTEKQVRYVALLQLKGITEETIWTKCLVKFTGIKVIGGNTDFYYFAKRRLRGFFKLTIEEFNYFSKKMSFLTKSYIGIHPIAKIGKFASCDELLRDTIFLQYLEAENEYQAFLYNKEEVHLYRLIAILYQNGKTYDNDLIEKRVKYFTRHASEVEKLITVMWMVGIKEYFTCKYNFLFCRLDDESEEQATTAPDMYGIIQNQVRMLTDGDITKREKVLSSNTWDALEEMNAKIRDAKELEKITNN